MSFSRFRDRLVGRSMIGAAATQAAGLAAASVITLLTYSLAARLYAVEDFGVAAVYMALVMLAAPVVTGRYEVAIVLPPDKSDAWSLAAVALACAAVLVSLLSLFIQVWPQAIPLATGSSGMSKMQALLPLGCVANALSVVALNLALRDGQFGPIALARVLGALAMSCITIGFGVLTANQSGLLWGQIAGSLTTATVLLIVLRSNIRELMAILSVSRLRGVAATYISFPTLSIPGDLLGVASRALPLIMFSNLFGDAAAGLLSLAHRAVGAAANVIGKALGEVFRKEAATEKIKNGGFELLFTRSLLTMSAVACVLFLPLIVVGPSLFAFVFGEAWRESGVFAAILAPLYAASFIGGNLGWTVYIVERQDVDIYFQLALLIVILPAALIGYFLGSPRAALGTLSILSSLCYAFYIGVCFKLSRRTAS